VNYLLLLALALFFGFAFEEFFGGEATPVPGGIRTFPLIAFTGAALYLIEPHYALAFIAGLLVLGWWVSLYIRSVVEGKRPPSDGPLIIPTSILIAYVLGPVTLTQPMWVPVALIVAAVILIGSREMLHDFVQRVPEEEAVTLAQFLLLVGVVLPLLYGAPKIPFTDITPFSVWLAVGAVSALSYASYLLQRYVWPRGGVLVTAALGGLYSSTATTVVLAREAHDEGVTSRITAGIITATAMMYVRILIVVAIFNAELARPLVVPMLALAALAGAVAVFFASRAENGKVMPAITASNPLKLGTAIVFAVLLIVISILSKWVQAHLGTQGVLVLAAVVGVTDIDPFVLSLAQGGAASIGIAMSAVAIVIAASSNNILKAAYTVAFARRRESAAPAGILTALCVLGVVAAAIMAR
jgi:uncharacterized membrane protein (DUF4010 family)